MEFSPFRQSFSFSGGEPVDGFEGALPKEQIKEWIEKQLNAAKVFDAIELVQTDPESAISQLQEMQTQHPEEPAIQIALAEAFLATGKSDDAAGIITKLEDRGFLEPRSGKNQSQARPSIEGKS